MTGKELLEYIKSKKYNCCYCASLQKKVITEGIGVIGDYNGIVCGGIEDMQINFDKIEAHNMCSGKAI